MSTLLSRVRFRPWAPVPLPHQRPQQPDSALRALLLACRLELRHARLRAHRGKRAQDTVGLWRLCSPSGGAYSRQRTVRSVGAVAVTACVTALADSCAGRFGRNLQSPSVPSLSELRNLRQQAQLDRSQGFDNFASEVTFDDQGTWIA
eukprot:scaffold47426_cov51-Phaeocystis_antarctica.AAC.3